MRSAKGEKFEDLIVWQKAHELAVGIYRLASHEPFCRDFGLRDQIQRAAVSVMSNISEDFERYSRPEFRQFLSVARSLVAEVRSQLHLARSLKYVTGEDFETISYLCKDISHLIGALRKSLDRGREI